MLVYIAGNPWDGVVGTDRQLATALSRSVPVLWVDPPFPLMATVRRRGRRSSGSLFGLDVLSENLFRLSSLGPPGLTRPVMRSLSSAALRSRIARLIDRLDADVLAVVLANPEALFPERVSGRKIYYVTDDWPAGADMMGLSRKRIETLAARNLKTADIVAAVSPWLLAKVLSAAPVQQASLMLPNGCDPDLFSTPPVARPVDVPKGTFAIVVGQINERLDLDAVKAVADRGLPVVVIGPRTERDPVASARLDNLFAHPKVEWLGTRLIDQLPAYIVAASVGLTPYADNEFNRASFPLKTLEYLAGGIPVVSTELPASRWLNTEFVTIATSIEEFGKVAHSIAVRRSPAGNAEEAARREFAKSHNWGSRARTLLDSISSAN